MLVALTRPDQALLLVLRGLFLSLCVVVMCCAVDDVLHEQVVAKKENEKCANHTDKISFRNAVVRLVMSSYLEHNYVITSPKEKEEEKEK